LCHAPSAGRSGSKFALKGADAARDRGSLGKMRPGFVIAGAIAGAHQCVLVGGIFLVNIDAKSPAWRDHFQISLLLLS
jgi:hypothetical protein